MRRLRAVRMRVVVRLSVTPQRLRHEGTGWRHGAVQQLHGAGGRRERIVVCGITHLLRRGRQRVGRRRCAKVWLRVLLYVRGLQEGLRVGRLRQRRVC